MDLGAYERTKFALAEILRTVRGSQYGPNACWTCSLGWPKTTSTSSSSAASGRGKSSLMNAILEMDCLPTGVVPQTSVTTTMTHGSAEMVTLQFHGISLIEDIHLDQLAAYVAERGNPGNAPDRGCGRAVTRGDCSSLFGLDYRLSKTQRSASSRRRGPTPRSPTARPPRDAPGRSPNRYRRRRRNRSSQW